MTITTKCKMKDFCIFILTHGRPDRVYTVKSLLAAGYTGDYYIVVDDEDETEGEYRKRYGSKVIVFDKKKVADETDEGDNFDDRRAIIYARNACFDIAKGWELNTLCSLMMITLRLCISLMQIKSLRSHGLRV